MLEGVPKTQTIKLRLPSWLLAAIKMWASKGHITVGRYIGLVISEKLKGR